MSDSIHPFLVFRCGGNAGTCSKPVFIPLGLLNQEDADDALRAQLQKVGWALIHNEVEEHSLLDLACPQCLMAYLTARLSQVAPPKEGEVIDVKDSGSSGE